MEGISSGKRNFNTIILMTSIFCIQSFAQHNDATQEIYALMHEQTHKESSTEQVVLGNFANIVQNFFNIVQDPHNKPLIGANVSQMLAGIVNVAVEVMKNFPFQADEQQQVEFIRKIELALKKGAINVSHAKEEHLEDQSLI